MVFDESLIAFTSDWVFYTDFWYFPVDERWIQSDCYWTMIGITSLIDSKGHKVWDEKDEWNCFYAIKVAPIETTEQHLEDLDGNIKFEE